MIEPTRNPRAAEIKPRFPLPDRLKNIGEEMRAAVAKKYQELMQDYFPVSSENRRSTDDSSFYDSDNPVFQSLVLDRAEDVVRLIREGEIDKMTELYRLSPFEKAFENRKEELKESQEEGRCLVFISFDLSKFKDINDRLGHDVGDKVLNAVGQKLKGRMRSQDVACRPGGDEFMILLNNVPQEHAEELTRQYHEVVTSISLEELGYGEQAREKGVRLDIRSNFGAMVIKKGDTAFFDKTRETSDLIMYKARELNPDQRNGYAFMMPGEGIVVKAKGDDGYTESYRGNEIPKPNEETRKHEIKGSLQRSLEKMSRATNYDCFSKEEYDAVESKIAEVGAAYHRASECVEHWESKK